MITKKFKIIFLLSIILWIVHGVEELVTGLDVVDPHVHSVFSYAQHMTPLHAAFFTFQIMFWLLLIVGFFMLLGSKWQLRLMTVLGLVFVYELHHLYKAIAIGGYYPGLWSALLFPIVGFFYWRELLNQQV